MIIMGVHDHNNTHLYQHYSNCRDSAHGLASRFLTLFFQYLTFSIGSLTVIGLLYNRVHFSIGIAIAILSFASSLFFKSIIRRYYAAAGASIGLCINMENELFKLNVKKYGLFSCIAEGGGRFYTSPQIKRAINMLLTLPQIAFILIAVMIVALQFEAIKRIISNKSSNPTILYAVSLRCTMYKTAG